MFKQSWMPTRGAKNNYRQAWASRLPAYRTSSVSSSKLSHQEAMLDSFQYWGPQASMPRWKDGLEGFSEERQSFFRDLSKLEVAVLRSIGSPWLSSACFLRWGSLLG